MDSDGTQFDGYPAVVDGSNFDGVYLGMDNLVSSFVNFKGNVQYFFLNNGSYYNYNPEHNKLNFMNSIENGWVGLGKYSEQIKNIFNSNNGKKFYFFLKNHTYIKWDAVDDVLMSGYPATIENNWPQSVVSNYDNLEAVFTSNTKTYFFYKNATYDRCSDSGCMTADKINIDINDNNWPGLEMFKNNILTISGATRYFENSYVFLKKMKYE